MKYSYILPITFALTIFTGCKGNHKSEKAEWMLEQAQTLFKNKHYQEALLTIDSLRHAYPNELTIRQKALTLYQNIALEQAQINLSKIDSALQSTQKEFLQMEKQVAAHKAALKANANELNKLTTTRMKRDSLQVKFDVECAKIKYIHKRQKQ